MWRCFNSKIVNILSFFFSFLRVEIKIRFLVIEFIPASVPAVIGSFHGFCWKNLLLWQKCVCLCVYACVDFGLSSPFLTLLAVWLKTACLITGMRGCAINPQTEIKLIWNLFLEPFRWCMNHISSTERWDQKWIPAFLLPVFLVFAVFQKKKKKENQTPLILSSNISRAHATSTLYSSSFFLQSFHFTWIPLSLHGLQTNWTKPSKTPKVVYKKKKIYIQTQEDEIKPSIMLCSILNSQSPNNGGACSWCQTDVMMSCTS